MSAASRRGKANWYRRVVAPLLALATLTGLYLLALSGLGHMALGAFLVNNEVAAARAATTMSTVGAVERYRGPFAEGTVAAAHAHDAEDLAAAEQRLREALALADPAGECVVRYNLALVLEAAAQELEKGDGPEAATAAAAGYREAAAMAAAAPAGCAQVPSAHHPPDPELSGAGDDPQESAADDLEEVADRASASADAAAERATDPGEDEDGDPSDDESEPAQPQEPSDRHSELEERMRQAHEAQYELGGRDGGGEGDLGDGTAQVPTPW